MSPGDRHKAAENARKAQLLWASQKSADARAARKAAIQRQQDEAILSAAGLNPEPRGRRRMAAKFEISKDSAGKFRFHLNAPNGEIIAASQGYETKANAEKGIEAIKTHSVRCGGGGPLRLAPFSFRSTRCARAVVAAVWRRCGR
jgi:uncharacterized protein YegP (UPF0339 family)